jgi:site-specific recombinase XerD
LVEEDPTKGDISEESNKTFRELEKYPEVQTWLRTVSEGTGKQYLKILERFCEWSGKTPDKLIQERDKEIRNADPNDRTGIRDLILDFRMHLEEERYAPKTINAWDGAIRSFFTAVLGREGMVNVRNYRNGCITTKKDLVPTLEELKKMLEVVDLEEKFRILFIAQTGMRISDALELKVGDIQRELELGRVPLAITYLPQKDRESIGERITFLGSDGVELLKQYLKWREENGEKVTAESPLFVGRSKKLGAASLTTISRQSMNSTLKDAAKKAGIGNGNGKYGRMRVHCLRKFFITQLTNHGVEDKVVNFLICHKLSEVDRVYWFRRVEELREIYRQREQYLNPLSGTQNRHNLEEIKGLKAKVEELEEQIKHLIDGSAFYEMMCSYIQKQGLNGEAQKSPEKFDVKIVSDEEEIISLASIGYECHRIGPNKWLMKRRIYV